MTTRKKTKIKSTTNKRQFLHIDNKCFGFFGIKFFWLVLDLLQSRFSKRSRSAIWKQGRYKQQQKRYNWFLGNSKGRDFTKACNHGYIGDSSLTYYFLCNYDSRLELGLTIENKSFRFNRSPVFWFSNILFWKLLLILF